MVIISDLFHYAVNIQRDNLNLCNATVNENSTAVALKPPLLVVFLSPFPGNSLELTRVLRHLKRLKPTFFFSQ